MCGEHLTPESLGRYEFKGNTGYYFLARFVHDHYLHDRHMSIPLEEAISEQLPDEITEESLLSLISVTNSH